MMNKEDQRRDSLPGAARPPPSRRGRPAIPGRAIAPTVSLSPGVPPCPPPKPPGTVLCFRSRRPGLSFPSPTWQRSGPLEARAGGGLVFRADRNARRRLARRVGKRTGQRSARRPKRRRARRPRVRRGSRGRSEPPRAGLLTINKPPGQT